MFAVFARNFMRSGKGVWSRLAAVQNSQEYIETSILRRVITQPFSIAERVSRESRSRKQQAQLSDNGRVCRPIVFPVHSSDREQTQC